MPRLGRDLEKLVETLEKCLTKEEVNIESPCFLKDRVTGKSREVDVLLSLGAGHHLQKIAFECKDWKRKVGVPEIEAFQTKTQDLQVNKAIVVSSNGFAATAIEKAKFYNIICLDISEVSGFEWMGIDSMQMKYLTATNIHWQINTSDESIKVASSSTIILVDGEEFTDNMQRGTAIQYMDSLDKDTLDSGESYRHLVECNVDNLQIFDSDTGTKWAVSECKMTVEFAVVTKEIPFKFVKYRNASDQSEITNAAMAEMNLADGIVGQLVILEEEDGSKSVLYSRQR